MNACLLPGTSKLEDLLTQMLKLWWTLSPVTWFKIITLYLSQLDAKTKATAVECNRDIREDNDIDYIGSCIL